MMRLSHHNTITGGTTHGWCTVHRAAVPPDGVPGFHQCDPRRVSAAGPALRGRVPSPDGGVADGWEAADRSPVYRVSWLRVSRRADASRMRPGGGQQLHTSAVWSEQCVRLRGSTWARMRVLAVFFCPHAPDLLPWRMSVLSHDFKRFERCTKLATSSLADRVTSSACPRATTPLQVGRPLPRLQCIQ